MLLQYLAPTWWLWSILAGIVLFSIAYGGLIRHFRYKNISERGRKVIFVYFVISIILMACGSVYVDSLPQDQLFIEPPKIANFNDAVPMTAGMIIMAVNMFALVLSPFHPRYIPVLFCLAIIILMGLQAYFDED